MTGLFILSALAIVFYQASASSVVHQEVFCPCVCSLEKVTNLDICRGTPSLCRPVRCSPRVGFACCDGMTTPLPPIENPLSPSSVKNNIDNIDQLTTDAARVDPVLTRKAAEIVLSCLLRVDKVGSRSTLLRMTSGKQGRPVNKKLAYMIIGLLKRSTRGTLIFFYNRLTRILTSTGWMKWERLLLA